MKALSVLFLILVSAFLLLVWPYSEGWNYYFSSVTICLVLALLIAPLFRRKFKGDEPKAQRTQPQAEFLDEINISSVPKPAK